MRIKKNQENINPDEKREKMLQFLFSRKSFQLTFDRSQLQIAESQY